jgi:hypothetical protein
MPSVFKLWPLTDDGRKWVEENVNYEPWQQSGAAIAIGHRFIGQIVEAMKAAGFVLGTDFAVL